MSRQNTVEIIVKTKDATGAGLTKSRTNVKKFADDVKKDLDDIEVHASKAGTKAGTAIEKETVKASKGTGAKIDKSIVDGTKGTGKKVGKQISDEIDQNILIKTKTSGGKAGVSWGSAFVDAAKMGFSTLAPLAAMPAAAGAGLAGVGLAGGLAGGVAGGVALAGLGAGAVGLGAYLLKDNKQVEASWSKTFKLIADDSRKAAGVLADEFVASGKKTADIWSKDVKPAVERIFENTQPLVDKFTTGLGKAVSDFLPGVETAVKNAGPAVDGFGKMLQGIFKGTGDGLAELSKNSDSLGTTMELAGEGIGASFKGVLGFVGDLSKTVAANEGDIRSWGKAIGNAAGEFKLMTQNALDLFFALDGKNAKGESLKEALKKFLEGKDYKEPESKAVAPRLFDEATGKQAKSADALRTSIGFLNHQKEMGIKVDESYIANSSNLLGIQDELVGANLDLANVTGHTTDSNRSNLAAMLELAAAGLPVRGALSQMVAGMNEAELAGLNATVTTDALGRSVINIPGYKPIILTADAANANPALDGVIGRLGAIQNKTVTVRVNSVYSSTGGLGSDGKTFHDLYNKGGWVGGSGGDYDSQPALLTPGEFVVTRKAAQQNGALLERLNQSAGGSVQLAGMGEGSGTAGGGSAGGVQEVRVVFDFLGNGDLVTLLKTAVRVRGGNPQVFG